MTTVAVIGAGDLGGAIAHALARRDAVRRVVLVDTSAAIAAGKALDIQQSGAIEGFHTRVSGTDDSTRVIGCSVCIIADRAGLRNEEWQGEAGLAQLITLRPLVGNAPVIFAGALQAELLLTSTREAGLARERAIGSSPEAIASAIRSIVALEARCAPAEVMLTVLGAPPADFVVPWSEASIGGYALERVLTTVQLGRIEARASRLWPPGVYSLGLAATRVTEAIVTSSRGALSVLTVLGGEFGVRNRVGALPVIFSALGIAHTRAPSLSTRERVQVETALAARGGS